MKYLVTGGAGFIGSHLAEALAQAGHEVTVLVHYNSAGSTGLLETSRARDLGIRLEWGDIRDSARVEQVAKRQDTIFHLAALIGIPYSYVSPEAYVETNVVGTLNVLNAARRADSPPKVVVTSTSEVFGTAQFVPIDERHPKSPQSPYAASKSAADQLAMSYFLSFELPVIVLRPFNTFGPRQSARAIIPTILGQLARGQQTLQLGDVSSRRDFTFVSDTVSGFIRAAEESGSALGKEINLGTGYSLTIRELVEMCAEVAGVEPKIEFEADRLRPPDSEVRNLESSNALAHSVLNWEPTFKGKEGLKAGLDLTWQWTTESLHATEASRRYAI